MTLCPLFKTFKNFIRAQDHSVQIKRDAEKTLRYDIWGTTGEQIRELFTKGISALEVNEKNSSHVVDKVERALDRMDNAQKNAKEFLDEIVYHEDNIVRSIAIHELMESVKGEADKARNLGIDIGTLAPTGVLPALPMSRVAASIGRKIAYQQGFRFKSDKADPKTAAEIETMYYAVGNKAIVDLQKDGYVNMHENTSTIKDYLDSAELDKKYTKTNEPSSKYQAVTLVEEKFGVTPDSESSAYFLNRTQANLEGTDLEAITNAITAVRNITQPATITVPDTEAKQTEADLRVNDDTQNINIDPVTERARKKLYDNAVYLDTEIHSLMKMLAEESQKTGMNASELIKKKFGSHPSLLKALFGLKRSEDYSVDKKESVRGQNLSKTTPLDDLVDNFYAMEQGDGPSALHLPLKNGRNARLYYVNSVLNPHGSKQDRYMLTPGKYTVDSSGPDFEYLVYNIFDAIGDKDLTAADIVGDTNRLNKVLATFEQYKKASNIERKLGLLSRLSAEFDGTDYVTLVTALQAIQDLRNPVDGKVTTEFAVSADATASGGTLTFMQALGTNPNVKTFLQNIGIIKGGDPDNEIDDLYGIMTEAIEAFVNDDPLPALDSMTVSKETNARRSIVGDTVALLFGTEKSDVRELSKDPTMTFVYGQGKAGAIATMSNSLANRVLDNLDDPKTKKFLTKLFGDSQHRDKTDEGLHKAVIAKLNEQGIPGQLWDIMDAAVNNEYLKEYKQRSENVAALVAKMDKKILSRFKVLPAAMHGQEANLSNIKKYGMPLTKVVEVSNEVEGGTGDTVLTREQRWTKTVADVSTIHSIDAAQLYGAIDKKLGKNGLIVVHDDMRGTVGDVRALEAEYLLQTQKIMQDYDIHEQIMLSIAAYDPDLAQSDAYKSVMGDIQGNIAEKKSVLSEMNMETHSLIGHGVKPQEYFNAEQSSPKAANQPQEQSSPSPTAMDKLVDLAGESDIIKQFILMANSSNIEFGKRNKFKTKSDTIKISKKATREQIEHEITHANTVAYIAKAYQETGSQANREVRYFKKSIDQITNGKTQLSEDTQARMDYIQGQGNEVDQVAEFVAVMSTESAVATELYEALSREVPSPSLMKRIEAFVKKVVESFVQVSDQDLQEAVDIEKLYTALESTVANGKAQREQNYQEASKYLKEIRKTYGYDTDKNSKAYRGPRGKVNYANMVVARMVTSAAERRGEQVLGNIHDKLTEISPLYVNVIGKISGIYDSSEQLQQLIHTITGEGVDKTKKADILAQFAKVMGQQSEMINQQMGKFHTALRPYSVEERKTIGRFVTETPLHDYFTLANKFRTAKDIDAEVIAVTAEVRTKNKEAINIIDNLVSTNVLGKPKGKFYNLEGAGYKDDSPNHMNIRKLLALKSIQAIGAKKFEKFLKDQELVNLIGDEVVANKLSLDNVDGTKYLNDSLVREQYKEPFTIKTVNEAQFRMYEDGENTGWEVLRRPEKGGLGIVYRKVIDSTTIPGAYTDTKLQSGDIDVYGKDAETVGIVKGDGLHKLRLTKKEKIALGVVEDFSQSLVRSTAHNMAVQESQSIRDAMLRKDTRMVIGQNTKKLTDIIKAENVDNPWFLKLKDGMEFDDLPKEVKAKYTKVGSRASNVGKFNEEVDLVRKDISHWLMGGNSSSLFTNPKAKWAMRIVKDLVAGAKIGMVVLNPIKIANDNISNVSYLGVMGVDPLFIAKNYKDIAKEYAGYSDLQRQILTLKIQLTARPNSPVIKKKIKNLQKRVAKNALGDLAKKGFINSLGSDLVSKNADTLSGLQADMHSALHYLLTEKDGKRNYVSHFIMKLQDLGFHGEDFLTYLGTIAKKTGGKNMQKELDQVAARLKEIRTEGDVVNYVSQYTNSPGSEAVRLGSATTDLTDVLAKETLYRHLVENEGASPEAARIKVLDSFPDYKENMPLAVKHLSDTGIIMFPSFWLRIQKVIYRMVRDKPLNLSTELMLEEAFGSNINTILDANIINKHNSFGGLIHSPHEPIGLNSVVPMHIW